MILRVGVPASSRPEAHDRCALTEIDLTHRAVIAVVDRDVDRGLPGRLREPGESFEVALVEEPWDVPGPELARRCAEAGDVVVRPAAAVAGDAGPDAADADVAVGRALDAARRWSGCGVIVAIDMVTGEAPVAAMAAAAMIAGARVLVLPEDSGNEAVREVRRAADVTEALLVERAG